MEKEMVSKVWNIHGLVGQVTPGILTWNKGSVSFIAPTGVQFSVPLSELKAIKWPFLRMGLGFDTVVSGKKYKFSFTKPNPNAPELDDTLGDQLLRLSDAGRLVDSIKTLSNVGADKTTTKQWKEILRPGK